MKRRHVLFMAAEAASTIPSWAAERPELPRSKSLKDEARMAADGGHPLIVMVSLAGCPPCDWVRASYLVPLLRESRQPIVQVDFQSQQALVDFQGRKRTEDDLVREWGIHAAPTLLFFGRDGRELAPRLAGASIPDFYGAYLDERVKLAQDSLR